MTDNEFLEQMLPALTDMGYHQLKVIPGRGICGILPFAFTTAIVYGIDDIGYKGRYCYSHQHVEILVAAYHIWDGKEDPVGPWIKHKGYIEYSNPLI